MVLCLNRHSFLNKRFVDEKIEIHSFLFLTSVILLHWWLARHFQFLEEKLEIMCFYMKACSKFILKFYSLFIQILFLWIKFNTGYIPQSLTVLWNRHILSSLGFDPWVGEIPWRRERLTTLVFWPGEVHRQVHGVAKSRTQLSNFHLHIVTWDLSYIAYFVILSKLNSWDNITSSHSHVTCHHFFNSFFVIVEEISPCYIIWHGFTTLSTYSLVSVYQVYGQSIKAVSKVHF